MAMPPPLPDKQYSKKISSDKKLLIGCGIGCGTIIILAIVAVAIGAWWFFSSEDQAPTNRILNKDSASAFRLEDISKNREAMQLISDLFKEAQRVDRKEFSEQLPESFKKFKNYFEGQQDPSQFIKWFTPKEVTVTMSLDEAGDTVFVLAANFGAGTRIGKMFLNAAFKNDEHLKGKKISTDHGELFLFDRNNDWNNSKSQQNIIGFYKGTLIISNDTKSALSALDLLAEENNTGKLSETLSGPFYQLSQKGHLAYGVVEGPFFIKPDFEPGLFMGEIGSEMKRAEIYLDKLSSENGILNLRINWNNKEFASMINERIVKFKPELIKKAEQNGFDLEITNILNDDQLDIQFRVNGLKDSLSAVFEIQDID